jgi:hypothetical protein
MVLRTCSASCNLSIESCEHGEVTTLHSLSSPVQNELVRSRVRGWAVRLRLRPARTHESSGQAWSQHSATCHPSLGERDV